MLMFFLQFCKGLFNSVTGYMANVFVSVFMRLIGQKSFTAMVLSDFWSSLIIAQ